MRKIRAIKKENAGVLPEMRTRRGGRRHPLKNPMTAGTYSRITVSLDM